MSAQSGSENAKASTNAIPADFIDLDAYPLDRRDPRGYATAVGSAQDQLTADGCCVLPGFARALALPILVNEADAVAGHAHRSFNRMTAYFSNDNPSLSAEDPKRRFHDRSNAFVPADHFGPDSGFRAIYKYAPIQNFIREALGVEDF